MVEVVRRDAGAREIPIVLLEPPASFDESAAIGPGVTRWFSVRARGPVSLLALGRSDLDALIVNFPVVANKVLIRLAAIMAARLQMLIGAQTLGEAEEHPEGAVRRRRGQVCRRRSGDRARRLAGRGLRSLIVPASVGGLLAYICRPLVVRLEGFRIPRGLAVVFLLLTFALVTLVSLNSVRAIMPSDIWIPAYRRSPSLTRLGLAW